ncbi:hypothetical protein ACFLZM_04000 [Thermodesulfobacteriota bacterium]
MSILFSSRQLGGIQVKNRFIHSACEDNLASESGEVTEEMIRKYRYLARGEIGLIISSHLFVHDSGRGNRYQAGIHTDEVIPGLKKWVDVVHRNGGLIALQLGHAGPQANKALINREPMGPGNMDDSEIRNIKETFALAAHRAWEAGADGIQLHAAHGYLLNQFLSPYFNQREDKWSGDDKNRFGLLGAIISNIKQTMPAGRIILIKLNTHDHTPEEGILPPLAATYAKWLADLQIDGLEISCGTSKGSPWNMCRGDVPVDEIVRSLPEHLKAKGEKAISSLAGRYPAEEGYNLYAAKTIKPEIGDLPLIVVGGWRSVEKMEAAMETGDADFISMCRPFIREPFLVKRLKEGRSRAATCKNCNRCLAALPNQMPVRCYYNGFPSESN